MDRKGLKCSRNSGISHMHLSQHRTKAVTLLALQNGKIYPQSSVPTRKLLIHRGSSTSSQHWSSGSKPFISKRLDMANIILSAIALADNDMSYAAIHQSCFHSIFPHMLFFSDLLNHMSLKTSLLYIIQNSTCTSVYNSLYEHYNALFIIWFYIFKGRFYIDFFFFFFWSQNPVWLLLHVDVFNRDFYWCHM